MENKDKVRTYNLHKLSLSTDYGDDKYGSLSWSVRNGYPRMSVFTEQSRTDRDTKTVFDYNKLITAPFSHIEAMAFLTDMETIVNGPNERKRQVKCFNTKFVNNQRTNDIELQATAEVGKDSNGLIYITATASNKRRVKFVLTTASKWHTPVSNGDDIVDPAELSKRYAIEYIRVARKQLNDIQRIEGVSLKLTPVKQ